MQIEISFNHIHCTKVCLVCPLVNSRSRVFLHSGKSLLVSCWRKMDGILPEIYNMTLPFTSWSYHNKLDSKYIYDELLHVSQYHDIFTGRLEL